MKFLGNMWEDDSLAMFRPAMGFSVSSDAMVYACSTDAIPPNMTTITIPYSTPTYEPPPSTPQPWSCEWCARTNLGDEVVCAGCGASMKVTVT